MVKSSASIRRDILALAKEYVAARDLETPARSHIPVSGKVLGAEELCAMLEASLDMWLTAGRFNADFEKAFAEKLGVKHALTVNSGSSANLLALTALTSPKLGGRRLKKGDEVVTVAAGFPTTVNPIIQNGLVPVFVDVELGSCNIDLKRVEEAIGPQTKAVFLAHTLGNMYDPEAMLALCQRHGLYLIEDSCDALGARWKGRYAGTWGHLATFSFYPAHHITMGEGGALVTDDTDLYRIVRSLRDWGRDCWCEPGHDGSCGRRFKNSLGKLPLGYDHKYTYSHVGYNLKITDWQAAIGVEQLKKLDAFLARRRRNAALLLEGLSEFQALFSLPEISPHCQPSWFGFLLSVRPEAPFTKQALVEYLEENGVATRQLFAGNLLRQPMMTDDHIALRIGASSRLYSNELNEEHYGLLPNTELVMERSFWVATAQNVDENDMETILGLVRKFVKARSHLSFGPPLTAAAGV